MGGQDPSWPKSRWPPRSSPWSSRPGKGGCSSPASAGRCSARALTWTRRSTAAPRGALLVPVQSRTGYPNQERYKMLKQKLIVTLIAAAFALPAFAQAPKGDAKAPAPADTKADTKAPADKPAKKAKKAKGKAKKDAKK